MRDWNPKTEARRQREDERRAALEQERALADRMAAAALGERVRPFRGAYLPDADALRVMEARRVARLEAEQLAFRIGEAVAAALIARGWRPKG